MDKTSILLTGAATLPALCSLVSPRFAGQVVAAELALGGLLYGAKWGLQNGDVISERITKALLRDGGERSLGIYLGIKFLAIPSCMLLGAAVGFVGPLALAYVVLK